MNIHKDVRLGLSERLPARMLGMTPYAALRKLAGLSLREASNFHDVGVDTVKSWSSGLSEAPERAFTQLRELVEQQEGWVECALVHISKVTGPKAETYLLTSDRQAKELGFPSLGAWKACIGRVAAKSPVPIAFIPAPTRAKVGEVA